MTEAPVKGIAKVTGVGLNCRWPKFWLDGADAHDDFPAGESRPFDRLGLDASVRLPRMLYNDADLAKLAKLIVHSDQQHLHRLEGLVRFLGRGLVWFLAD